MGIHLINGFAMCIPLLRFFSPLIHPCTAWLLRHTQAQTSGVACACRGRCHTVVRVCTRYGYASYYQLAELCPLCGGQMGPPGSQRDLIPAIGHVHVFWRHVGACTWGHNSANNGGKRGRTLAFDSPRRLLSIRTVCGAYDWPPRSQSGLHPITMVSNG